MNQGGRGVKKGQKSVNVVCERTLIVVEIFYGLGGGHERRIINTSSVSQMMNVVMVMLNALTVGANFDHSSGTCVIGEERF